MHSNVTKQHITEVKTKSKALSLARSKFWVELSYERVYRHGELRLSCSCCKWRPERSSTETHSSLRNDLFPVESPFDENAFWISSDGREQRQEKEKERRELEAKRRLRSHSTCCVHVQVLVGFVFAISLSVSLSLFLLCVISLVLVFDVYEIASKASLSQSKAFAYAQTILTVFTWVRGGDRAFDLYLLLSSRCPPIFDEYKCSPTHLNQRPALPVGLSPYSYRKHV